MRKIEFLFEGNFDVEGQPRHYGKGDVVDVPEADAEKLVRDKCAKSYVKEKVKYERKNS